MTIPYPQQSTAGMSQGAPHSHHQHHAPSQTQVSHNTADIVYDDNPQWLHCNACYAAYTELVNNNNPNNNQSLPFYLTSCGHVCCRVCLGSVNNQHPHSHNGYGQQQQQNPDLLVKSCPVCRNQAEIVVLDVDQMPSNIQSYFMPVARLLDDALLVYRFQQTNAIQLITFLKSQVDKQNGFLKQAKTELQKMKGLYESNNQLRQENARLKQSLQQQNHQRPVTSQPQRSQQLYPQQQQQQQSFPSVPSRPRSMHNPPIPPSPQRLSMGVPGVSPRPNTSASSPSHSSAGGRSSRQGYRPPQPLQQQNQQRPNTGLPNPQKRPYTSSQQSSSSSQRTQFTPQYHQPNTFIPQRSTSVPASPRFPNNNSYQQQQPQQQKNSYPSRPNTSFSMY